MPGKMPDKLVRWGCAILVAGLCTGCAGRPARPVMVSQPGDDQMSCARYEAELDLIERSISHLVPQTHKYERNAALGVSGMVLLVPLFFMDISKAEEIELSAYVKRHNRLLELSRAANCGLDAAPIVVLTDDRGTPQSVDPIE